MSVGTWTRLSAVPVRSLNRRPQPRHRKRRKPWTVRPSCSVVDDEWQCGQFMAALLIAQNRPENLSANAFPGKLPRDLTEPSGEDHGDEREGTPEDASKGSLATSKPGAGPPPGTQL